MKRRTFLQLLSSLPLASLVLSKVRGAPVSREPLPRVYIDDVDITPFSSLGEANGYVGYCSQWPSGKPTRDDIADIIENYGVRRS